MLVDFSSFISIRKALGREKNSMDVHLQTEPEICFVAIVLSETLLLEGERPPPRFQNYIFVEFHTGIRERLEVSLPELEYGSITRIKIPPYLTLNRNIFVISICCSFIRLFRNLALVPLENKSLIYGASGFKN